jgi:hypothetical protein
MLGIFLELSTLSISNFPEGVLLDEWAIAPSCIPNIRALDLIVEPYKFPLM